MKTIAGNVVNNKFAITNNLYYNASNGAQGFKQPNVLPTAKRGQNPVLFDRTDPAQPGQLSHRDGTSAPSRIPGGR